MSQRDWIPGALYMTATPDDGTRWRCLDYSDTGRGIPLVWIVEVKPTTEFDSEWSMITDIVRMVPDESDESTAAVMQSRRANANTTPTQTPESGKRPGTGKAQTAPGGE